MQGRRLTFLLMQTLTRGISFLSLVLCIAALVGGVAHAQQAPPLPSGVTLNSNGIPCPISTTSAAGNSGLDQLVNAINNLSGPMFTYGGQIALMFCKLLGTVEVLWFLYTTLWKRHSITELLEGYIFKMIAILFLFSFINYLSMNQGAAIKNFVYTGFSQLASHVAQGPGGNYFSTSNTTFQVNNGSPATGPLDQIATDANCNAYAILQYPAAEWAQNLQLGTSFFGMANDLKALVELGSAMIPMIAALIATIVMCLAYMFLLVLMAITIIDSSLMLAIGIFLLGFGASRWTHSISQSYFKYCLSMGFKVFALQIISSIGTVIIANIVKSDIALYNGQFFQGAGGFPIPAIDILSSIGIVLVSIVTIGMALNADKMATTLASGTPAFGMTGAALEGIGMAATAAAAVGGGAAVALAGKGAGSIGAGNTPGGGGPMQIAQGVKNATSAAANTNGTSGSAAPAAPKLASGASTPAAPPALTGGGSGSGAGDGSGAPGRGNVQPVAQEGSSGGGDNSGATQGDAAGATSGSGGMSAQDMKEAFSQALQESGLGGGGAQEMPKGKIHTARRAAALLGHAIHGSHLNHVGNMLDKTEQQSMNRKLALAGVVRDLTKNATSHDVGGGHSFGPMHGQQ